MKLFGLMVLAAACAQPVKACDLCAIYAATQASGETGHGFYGGVAEQFTRFATVQDGGHEIMRDGQFINSSVAQVFAGFNVNNRLSLQLNVPVIYREFGSATDHGTESGIGDVSLIANYMANQKLRENFTFQWSVLGGVKFPTGNANRLGDPDFAEGIGGHDLALGSGSFDGLVGAGAYVRWKRAFLSGSVQYAIRSEGDFEHRYANDLTWGGGPGIYLALEHQYTLSLQMIVSGEYKGKDTFSGVADGDSAETIVALGPQLNFTWSTRLSAVLGVDLPVSIYNTGVQVVPDYRVRAAVTWRF